MGPGRRFPGSSLQHPVVRTELAALFDFGSNGTGRKNVSYDTRGQYSLFRDSAVFTGFPASLEFSAAFARALESSRSARNQSSAGEPLRRPRFSQYEYARRAISSRVMGLRGGRGSRVSRRVRGLCDGRAGSMFCVKVHRITIYNKTRRYYGCIMESTSADANRHGTFSRSALVQGRHYL
jgi:hypothetical protein